MTTGQMDDNVNIVDVKTSGGYIGANKNEL
jgi:hypothetical protein